MSSISDIILWIKMILIRVPLYKKKQEEKLPNASITILMLSKGSFLTSFLLLFFFHSMKHGALHRIYAASILICAQKMCEKRKKSKQETFPLNFKISSMLYLFTLVRSPCCIVYSQSDWNESNFHIHIKWIVWHWMPSIGAVYSVQCVQKCL